MANLWVRCTICKTRHAKWRACTPLETKFTPAQWKAWQRAQYQIREAQEMARRQWERTMQQGSEWPAPRPRASKRAPKVETPPPVDMAKVRRWLAKRPRGEF